MTKHHYGLPQKEQINLPKNVTPSRKTNTCLPQNGLFQHGQTIFQPRKISGTKIVFFFLPGTSTLSVLPGPLTVGTTCSRKVLLRPQLLTSPPTIMMFVGPPFQKSDDKISSAPSTGPRNGYTGVTRLSSKFRSPPRGLIKRHPGAGPREVSTMDL